MLCVLRDFFLLYYNVILSWIESKSFSSYCNVSGGSNVAFDEYSCWVQIQVFFIQITPNSQILDFEFIRNVILHGHDWKNKLDIQMKNIVHNVFEEMLQRQTNQF